MTRRLGLDLWDVVIQAAATACLAFALATVLSGKLEEVAAATVFGASAVVLAVRRHYALKRAPPTPGEIEALRLEELEQRLQDLETLPLRLAELEERVDFSERLLVQGRQQTSQTDQPG